MREFYIWGMEKLPITAAIASRYPLRLKILRLNSLLGWKSGKRSNTAILTRLVFLLREFRLKHFAGSFAGVWYTSFNKGQAIRVTSREAGSIAKRRIAAGRYLVISPQGGDLGFLLQAAQGILYIQPQFCSSSFKFIFLFELYIFLFRFQPVQNDFSFPVLRWNYIFDDRQSFAGECKKTKNLIGLKLNDFLIWGCNFSSGLYLLLMNENLLGRENGKCSEIVIFSVTWGRAKLL